jgi:hypothetical protein
MTLDSVQAIVAALHDAHVRFLIAGGLAVNAHGVLRFTKNVDVVPQLAPDNIERAFGALAALGYKSSVPVTAAQFADESVRSRWVREKNIAVLQLWSDAHRETPIDIFASEPFNFDVEYARALLKPLVDIPVRFVCLKTLIQMKEAVGRAQDLADAENLRLRIEDDGSG